MSEKNVLIADTYNFKNHEGWRARCDNVSSITDMERYIPWYLDCNRDRYPYWFGKLDSRNSFLAESLQNYFSTIEIKHQTLVFFECCLTQ